MPKAKGKGRFESAATAEGCAIQMGVLPWQRGGRQPPNPGTFPVSGRASVRKPKHLPTSGNSKLARTLRTLRPTADLFGQHAFGTARQG